MIPFDTIVAMEIEEASLGPSPLPYVTLKVVGESRVSLDEDTEAQLQGENPSLYRYFEQWGEVGKLVLIGAGLVYKPLSIAAKKSSVQLPVVDQSTIEDAEGDPFWTEIANNVFLAREDPNGIRTVQDQLQVRFARWRPENPHLMRQLENFLQELEQRPLEAIDRILVTIGALMTYDYLRRQSEKSQRK